MRPAKHLLFALLLCLGITGCYATKLISVPMRVAGALASAVPVVGNAAHDTVDKAADVVDDLP